MEAGQGTPGHAQGQVSASFSAAQLLDLAHKVFAPPQFRRQVRVAGALSVRTGTQLHVLHYTITAWYGELDSLGHSPHLTCMHISLSPCL